MKVGFKFYSAGEDRELWTMLKPGTKDLKSWGRIQSAKISYADFEITEATVHIVNPSDELVRAMLAIVIGEPGPMESGLEYLTGSIWVQDTDFGYEPLPLFLGIILKISYSDGAVPSLTITLHDFKRLITLTRDVQDYQNLTDQDVAGMLFLRLQEAIDDGSNRLLQNIVVDQEAMDSKRTTTSTGAVRQWVARLNVDPALVTQDLRPITELVTVSDSNHRRVQPRMTDMTVLQKLRVYAYILGFTISYSVAKDDAGKAFVKLTIKSIAGANELSAGTYTRGDGQVISASFDYDPPGQVMQRNVLSKRFDPANEMWMLENAQQCLSVDKDGIIRSKSGEQLSADAIRGMNVPTDPKTGQPLSQSEYLKRVGGLFKENADLYGSSSKKNLREYHDRIAYRKGLMVPGTTPQSIEQPTDVAGTDMISFQENLAQAGSLYWRITAKLTTRLNPFLTTTDYLTLGGWGVWDGTYAIRTFNHTIAENSTTTFDLTYGDPVRLSG